MLLAGHLKMTLAELSERMDCQELVQWMAYYDLHPFGDEWKQTYTLCAMVGNAAGGKKGGQAFSLKDFMPSDARLPGDSEILAAFAPLMHKKK